MTPDPRHLAYLLAIQEHGSLTGAAKFLGLSQPALSNSVALLERRIGTKVLTRSGRGVVVNDFGMILVRRAREIRSLLSGAAEDIRLKRAGQSGPLSIGAIPGAVEYLLPQALFELRRRAAGLDITVIQGLDVSLNEALLSGELDLVVGAVGEPLPPVELDEELLTEDPYVLAVGLQHPLAGRNSIRLPELGAEFWVMPRPGGTAYAHVHAIFLNAGVAWPRQLINTNSFALAKQLVSQSDAVALMPRLTTAGPNLPIRGILVPEAGVSKMGVRRRRGGLSPMAELFIEILRGIAAALRAGHAPVA